MSVGYGEKSKERKEKEFVFEISVLGQYFIRKKMSSLRAFMFRQARTCTCKRKLIRNFDSYHKLIQSTNLEIDSSTSKTLLIVDNTYAISDDI